MNNFFKFQLTITVATLLFFNAAIAKEGSIRIITNPVRAPVELFSPVMVIAKFPTKAPAKATAVPTKPTTVPTKPTAVPTKPTAVPTKQTAVPTKPTAVPTKPTAVPTKPTAVPTKPIAVPTKPPLQRFPSVVIAPATLEIPFHN